MEDGEGGGGSTLSRIALPSRPIHLRHKRDCAPKMNITFQVDMNNNCTLLKTDLRKKCQ